MSTAVQSPRSREGGEFGAALAEGFARRIAALAVRLGAAPVAVTWARRAAFAVSRATGAGHVCVSLARLAQRYDDTAQSALAALRSSGVVSDGSEDAGALRPLVVDRGGRLYLARYYEDERRLAEQVSGQPRRDGRRHDCRARCRPAPAQGPGGSHGSAPPSAGCVRCGADRRRTPGRSPCGW